ncbi:MAG: ABC transporter ATP-binding protein [Gammaproteobacteria bacterium]|nr:ABC transporter ATP-binding protein [Gammaproteobacteria bacterium]
MLEQRGVNAFYGQSHVLHDVSLRLEDGAGLAIVGLNGMGKSTLLKSLLGAGPSVQGGILLDGEDITRLAPHQRVRRGLSLVPEDRRIYPHLTVAENLALAGYAKIKGRTPYSVEEVLEIFPLLKKLAGRKGFQLSGGEQQLVAVARSVLARPRFLLLDEPTEGLAPLIVDSMGEEIRAIRQREKMALLLAEQNVEFARACTEHVLVLNVGRVAFSGSWEAFDADPSIREKHLSL